MTVGDILEQYLKANGYDGLYQPGECACKLGDLCPCSELRDDCEAGYYRKATEDDESEYDWYIGKDKPGDVDNTPQAIDPEEKKEK